MRKNLKATFSPTIVHYLNGKKVASGIDDLYKRFLTLDKRYQTVTVLLPFDDYVIDQNQHKVAIQYTIHFVLQDHHKKILHAQTIFEIQDGKINKFNEVSSFEEDHL